jgi:hypothetical protein
MHRTLAVIVLSLLALGSSADSNSLSSDASSSTGSVSSGNSGGSSNSNSKLPVPYNYEVGHTIGFGSARKLDASATPTLVTPEVVSNLRREAGSGKKGVLTLRQLRAGSLQLA